MPARSANRPASNDSRRNDSNAEPYWKVLDPIDGGYGYGKEITSKDGKATFDEFEINVYDDRSDRGQRRAGIQMQVRKTGKFGATAVITLESLAEFEELVDDLSSALEEMRKADSPAPKRRKPARTAR